MSSPTGPTPPPPMYSASVPPSAPEPAGPGLSEPQRLVNVFIAPSKTFEDLKRNPSWWVPWLVTAIFLVIFGAVAVQKIDIARFIQQQIEKSPSAQRRMEQLTPEQRERGIAMQATGTKVVFYIYPVFTLVGGLVIAAVLMAVFNFMLGAEVPFQRAMAVVFYSFVPLIISTVLLTVSLLASSDPNTIDLTNPMPTNPGFFMDPQGNKFIYAIISSLDIFSIWVVTLLGLGFAKASSNRKPSVSTGITTMFVVFAIFVLGRAAWRSLF
ncbi:MAG TPA: YIP1 family protein [Candidatus Angelobacter sp.]|nr:YIP1 family protein [Candidatus Angelobacter sp.]